MRRPRRLTEAALAAFTVTAVATGLCAGPSAFADTGSPSELYVSNSSACSDSGPGTQAEPFCTIQAAANVVQPGQTVLISNVYTNAARFGAVTLTRSGTPSQPITFEADPQPGHGPVGVDSPQGSTPLTLQNVHDVTVRGVTVYRHADAVNVVGSQDVTLDRLTTSSDDGSTTGDDVRIDGASSGVTVSRSTLTGSTTAGHAVQVSAGAQDITVTTDLIPGQDATAVVMDGTVNAAVTSNSMLDNCGTEVALMGGTTGWVENNVLATQKTTRTTACPGDPVVSVDASSAAGVTSDYNDFDSADAANRASYSWAGTSYATPADRTSVTGGGTHDGYTSSLPVGTNASFGIDAADADAPGELSTDLNGFRHADDPSVANTGTGNIGYADRGAYEAHDTITVPADESASPTKGAVPLSTSVLVGDATSAWGEPLTYAVDFGDGSAPVTATAGNPAQHTYGTPGGYPETVTVTDADGVTQTRSTQVVAATDDPAPATLSAHTVLGAVGAIGGDAVFAIPTTDDFEIASQTIAYGDGSTDTVPVGVTTVSHQYARPGTHTATLTRTDVLGRVSTAKATFTATDSSTAAASVKPVTATIAAHGTWTIPGSSLGLSNADPAELRVNATGAASGGWLTAYPAGGTRPSASTLNFPAGHNASNQETVVPSSTGGMALYNGAASSVKVSVAVVGRFSPNAQGDSYHPTSPTTLVDTRYGTGGVTGPVGAGKTLTVQVAGRNGVPANATAVTLDVAENTTKAPGALTVAPHGTTGDAVTASYWAAGESVTNLVTVPLADGRVTLTNTSTGSANLLVAQVGWYGADTTGSGAWPVPPTRVFNTQTGLGEPGGRAVKLAAHGTLKVKVAGAAGLPSSGLTAADLNLTVSAPTASGWLVAYPDGTTRPSAGCLNYTKGHTTAGQAVIKVGPDGEIDLYNPTTTAIDVFTDIHGGYVPMT